MLMLLKSKKQNQKKPVTYKRKLIKEFPFAMGMDKCSWFAWLTKGKGHKFC